VKSITFIAAGLSGGGIEKAFSSLANHLSSRGYEISAILLFQSEHFYKLDENIKVIEPEIYRQDYNKYIYALKTIPYLRKGIRRFNPDVILSYGEWFNPFVILSTRGLGIPIYISDRMSPTLKLGFVQDTAKKILYRFADGIMAQTSYAKDLIFSRTGSNNIKVIPNPVNVIEKMDLPVENQIVSVGRLSREKGHAILIKAFHEIKNKEWKLHIIGDGKERHFLEKLVEELELNSRVNFHGHKRNFSKILSQSRIFILPSLSEGFPNALIEAMSVPLACISSDCVAGPSDIIKHRKNGILVPPNNVIALARTIDMLIEDENLQNQISREAFRVREELKFEKIADTILSFIGKEKPKA
jgi:glycosyltransferase involved in cell wall biosynthesis